MEAAEYTCRKCGQSYPPPAGATAKKVKVCRPCQNEYLRNLRAKWRADGTLYERRDRMKTWQANYVAEYRRLPEKIERRREVDRERYRRQKGTPEFIAREKLRYRVSAGQILRQPCEVCGNKKTQAHHDDYSKPFDVRWLCVEHHRELHVAMRRKGCSS